MMVLGGTCLCAICLWMVFRCGKRKGSKIVVVVPNANGHSFCPSESHSPIKDVQLSLVKNGERDTLMNSGNDDEVVDVREFEGGEEGEQKQENDESISEELWAPGNEGITTSTGNVSVRL